MLATIGSTAPFVGLFGTVWGIMNAFIGISEDEYASDAQSLVDGFGLSFPVVHDQGNVLAGRFRVSEMPVTFVIDGQGVVQWVGGPGQDEDDLASAIAAYAG